MNHQDSRNVTTKTFSPTALALVLGLALAFPGSAALAINNPIPGVDIIVKKNPGGIAVVVPIDDSGKFSLRLKEPGSHTISTVCRQPSGCLPHKLSGTLKPGAEGEPSIIGILINLLLPTPTASANGTSYTFTVGDRGVVLSGQIPSAASVRVAAGDVNGDGVEARKAGEPIKGGGPRPPPIVVPGTLALTEANDALVGVSTTRGTAPRSDGGGGKPGISNQAAAGGLISYATDPPPKGGDKELPGLAGGIPIPIIALDHPGYPITGINISLPANPDAKVLVSGDVKPGRGPVSTPVKLQQPPPNQLREKETGGGDETPHNKYADDFTQLKGRVEKSVAVKVQTTALQTSDSSTMPGEDGKLPGNLRIINNSETESANVDGNTPVNGIGGTGGGRFTFKPTSPVADSANADSSNRDHIDQDAQTDIKKRTAVQPGGPGDARRVTDSGPDSGNVELPGKKRLYKGVVTLVRGTAPNPGGEVDVPEARTFEVTVQPVNDAPSKAGDPIPEPVGPPVKVQLRNVDTGALAGTTVLATGSNFPDKDGLAVTTLRKGEFTFSLPVGNYVVEIVDAAGKIIGMSTSIAVSSGGTVMRSSDGKKMIFDRWGNLIATPITVEDEKFKANNKVTNDREKRSIAAPNNSGDVKFALHADHLGVGIAAPNNSGDVKLPGLAGETIQPTYLPDPPARSKPSKGGDAKLPGNLRINSINETESANVDRNTPVNGVGGTGGGRFTFKPTSPVADSANADSSNRDHIDQDAQTDIKKRTAVQPGGPGNVRLRVPADVSTLRGTAPGPDERDVKLGTAAMANEPLTDGLMILRKNSGGITISTPAGADTEGIRPSLDVDRNNSTDPIVAAPKGGDKELPGLAGGPIPGIDVKLGSPGGNPGGNGIMATLNSSGAIVAAEAIASSKTDSQGNFRFEKMPAGDYELKFPGLPAQSLTVGEDGIAAGSVKRGSDGSISIFDRWGKSFTAPPPKAGNAKQGTPDQTSKAAESPVGFGSGNHTMGAGPGAGLGAGPGMIPSGATMGGAGGPGPMSPMGAGPMGGGPGGAMRP